MKYFVTLPSGREHLIEIVEGAGGALSVSVDGTPVEADAAGPPSQSRSGRGASSIRIGGRSIELWLEGTPPSLGVIADGQRFFAKVESERMRIRAAAKPSAAGEGVVRSPMPGRVVRVLVAEGDVVEPGAPVAVVEAMKMENELFSERGGTVKRVHVAAGATVEGGAPLVELGE
jgi:biotin carboxyl carrier protein